MATFSLLRGMGIGKRLRLVFGCILTLMFLGSGVSLWYLREIRKQVERVSLVEQRMTAVLQIDHGVLNLLNHLYRAAETNQKEHFSAEAERLLDVLRVETAWANGVLRGIQPDDDRQRFILDSLHARFDTLPSRVQALITLARADDWPALHARLRNEVDRTDDVASALVSDINANLENSRRELVDQVQQAQRRTTAVLAVTGISGLVVAGFLGFVVTRSITQPLTSLESGTRALSKGKLGVQVEVRGRDELAELALAFNRSSRELEEIYEKLRDSEAHFRSLIENASDFIMIVSRTGSIVYASPSSARLLGDALRGRPIRDFVHPEAVPVLDSILASDGSAAAEPRNFELSLRRHDGCFRVIEGVATNLARDPNVSGILVNARDITERREAEQALREREEQLRQVQKLEAIGLLAGGVAHDFNNLLTVINGYSSFLMEKLDPNEPAHGYSKSILRAGERAADLTRQLLAFGRKQMLRTTVVNLNELAMEAGELLSRVIGEDIELVSKLEPGLAGVEADQNQIHQVLMNLAANARDAMPGGGRLTIETANVTLERPLVSSATEIPPGRYVRLAVSDTGQGMDEATRQRIFEPFFTTKEQGKGTGLGLATVYGVVRQTGGHILVESDIGKGSTFLIYFLRVDRAVEAVQEPPAAQPMTGTETILVVEDEVEVRQIASRSLRACGYQVIEACDAEEALAQYRTVAGQVHLLLTDVVMPGMTGVELSRHLLNRDSSLKVIYVSGYADDVLLRHDEMADTASFLQKPYRPSELAARVREVLER